MRADKIGDRRVLFVCHQARLTGAPIALFRVLEALQHDSSTPFCFRVCVRIPGPLLQKFVDAGIPFVCSYAVTLALHSWSVRKVWGLIKHYFDFTILLLRYRPHVVYSNTVDNSIEVMLGRALGAKTIVHVHEAESIVSLLLRRLVWSRIFTTKYVAVSDYVRRVLRKLLRVDSLVIYNGLSGHRVRHHHEIPVRSGDKTLAVIGSICPNKGQLLAVEALATLRASGHPVTLKLVGPSDDLEYAASVQRAALERGLERYVEFVGERSENLYRDIDIVLIPSQEETFSLVALEAMAEGVLVVAANTGGIPEVVQDGKTGLLFETGSSKELASRVETAITLPALISEITALAQQRVLCAFALEKTVDAVTQVILNVMSGDTNPRGELAR